MTRGLTIRKKNYLSLYFSLEFHLFAILRAFNLAFSGSIDELLLSSRIELNEIVYMHGMYCNT